MLLVGFLRLSLSFAFLMTGSKAGLPSPKTRARMLAAVTCDESVLEPFSLLETAESSLDSDVVCEREEAALLLVCRRRSRRGDVLRGAITAKDSLTPAVSGPGLGSRTWIFVGSGSEG